MLQGAIAPQLEFNARLLVETLRVFDDEQRLAGLDHSPGGRWRLHDAAREGSADVLQALVREQGRHGDAAIERQQQHPYQAREHDEADARPQLRPDCGTLATDHGKLAQHGAQQQDVHLERGNKRASDRPEEAEHRCGDRHGDDDAVRRGGERVGAHQPGLRMVLGRSPPPPEAELAQTVAQQREGARLQVVDAPHVHEQEIAIEAHERVEVDEQRGKDRGARQIEGETARDAVGQH